VQAVDVDNGSARIVSQLPGAVTEAAAFTLDGAVFLAGGVRAGIVQRGVFRLDPGSGSLTAVATLPEPRADAAVAVVGGTAYLIGGESPGRLASVVTLQAT
jgi:N-acetylneuraminic acid mutarotase